MNGKGLDRHMFGLFVVCKGFGYVSTVVKYVAQCYQQDVGCTPAFPKSQCDVAIKSPWQFSGKQVPEGCTDDAMDSVN